MVDLLKKCVNWSNELIKGHTLNLLKLYIHYENSVYTQQNGLISSKRTEGIPHFHNSLKIKTKSPRLLFIFTTDYSLCSTGNGCENLVSLYLGFSVHH